MQRFFIDTDPGTDDAIALLMALNAPDVHVAGITVTAGNASLDHCLRNTLGLLEHMGRTEIPVAKGAEAPLAGQFEYGYDFHGRRGMGIRFPRPGISPVEAPAADFLAGMLAAQEDPVTLIALGPLTNMALLLQDHPEARNRIGRLVVMGGALDRGNATPYAEFNVYNDPDAAAIVFASGLPTLLAPLEPCVQVAMEPRDLARYRDERTLGARLAYRILRKWFERRGFDQQYDPCDPLAMALALRPELGRYEQGRIAVDTSGGQQRGQTVFTPGEGNVRAAVGVDGEAFHEYMDGLLKAR